MVSIIIVAYNNKKVLSRCLDSILANKNKENIEIIVIDNNSKDGTKYLFEKDRYNKIKYIVNSENIGFGRANNQGAAIAKNSYLWFLNSDTYIEDDFLNKFKLLISNYNNLIVFSPLVYNFRKELESRFYGVFPSLINTFLAKFFPKKKDLNKNLKFFNVDWVSGASMIVRKEAFISAGGFDRRFFMYFEDIDLCWRLKDLDYKTFIVSDLSVYHQKGASLDKNPKLRKKYYYNSQDVFFKKHYNIIIYILMKVMRKIYLLFKKI